MSAKPKIHCAIYTRKSSEEGLEQAFNSLDAQYEACAAFIQSQKNEGWVLLPTRYDDGGISGGTLERPAIQQLLAGIDAGKIDRIVVYKVDRLTRSLTDFSKLVERFDAAGCSFVSVTQSFNTATSMGRLTLNMLLSFAQFEREVTGERIRDKIAASKKKGLWMGGLTPLGYDARDRTLIINAAEAATVRHIFGLYDRLPHVREVKKEADRLGLTTKHRVRSDGTSVGGVPFSRGRIYHLLSNPVYIGHIRHRDDSYDGQHDPIIDLPLWDRVQQKLMQGASRQRQKTTSGSQSPLAGKFRDETGDLLTPSHANKKGRRYRYYTSRRLITQSGDKDLEGWRLPAKALEDAVKTLISAALNRSSTAADLIRDASASEIVSLRSRFDGLTKRFTEDHTDPLLAAIVESGRIEPGRLQITLSADALAEALDLAPDRIKPEALDLSSSFTLRRRGAEARLILEEDRAEVDQILLRNLAQGVAWFEEITGGTTIKDIGKRHGTTRQRVSAMVDLAFLAPDLMKRIVDGRQPISLTSEQVVKSPIPTLWIDQRDLFADV